MKKYELIYRGQFKKDLKKYLQDKNAFTEIEIILLLLQNFGVSGIPQSKKPHLLKGNYKNHWECHILPDLLLIWLQFDEENKQIHLIRIGSHAEILKM